MKNLLITIGAILFCMTEAQAQPQIDRLFDFEIGMEYHYQNFQDDKTFHPQQIQTYGSDIIWDLDKLDWIDQVHTHRIISPAGSEGADDHIDCSFVLQEEDGVEHYYSRHAHELEYLGNSYSNAVFLQSPVRMSYPTSFKVHGHAQDIEFDSRAERPGHWTHHARYNAYGTLKLRGETYEHTALYVIKGGTDMVKKVEYVWVQEGEVFPILHMAYVEVNGETEWEYVRSKYEYPSEDLTKHIEGNDLNLIVYPNPTRGAIDIVLEDRESDMLILQYDITGALLAQQRCSSAGPCRVEIPGGPGVYLMEVQLEGHEHRVLRVVKE